jgi:hypothetical protein
VHVTVQTGYSRSSFTGGKASIFVRKALQVLPCEIKKALAFLSSQKGPAFFDEDDACSRVQELRGSASELLRALPAVSCAAFSLCGQKIASVIHYPVFDSSEG